MDVERLTQWYQYQLEKGCLKVTCTNPLCKRNQNMPPDILQQNPRTLARKLAENHSKEPHLCQYLPYLMLHPSDEAVLEAFEAVASNASGIWNEAERSTIQSVLGCFDIFSLILLDNKLPLGPENSAINDEKMFLFTGALIRDENFSTALGFQIAKLARSALTSLAEPTFSAVRGFLLLLYFPQIFTPNLIDYVLKPLLENLSRLSFDQLKLYSNWLSKLPLLMKQVVGAVHFAVSIFFGSCSHADPHCDEVVSLIKALTVVVKANGISENRMPPEVFYNWHIDHRINPQKEFERSVFHQSFSYLTLPFVLTLSTKAGIVQMESQQMMMTMAMRSFLMSPTPFISRNDLFFTIFIRRDHLIEDALSQISIQDPVNFLKKLQVIFEGEVAQDSGGPSREFLQLIAEKMFSPDFGMFHLTDDQYLWFTPSSTEGDSSFFLVGAIVGLAIHNSIILPVRFPVLLYKKLLGSELSVSDLREIDSSLAISLQNVDKMVKMGQEIDELGLSFDITYSSLGEKKIVTLKPGMEGKGVTSDNFLLYLNAYVDWCLDKSVKAQYESFKKGFEMTCRAPCYQLFEPAELATLVSGEEIMDWASLEKNSKYIDGYSKDSQAIVWFWDIFHTMDKEDKIRFLKFSTGMGRAPIGGLANLKLTIQRTTDVNRLPISHTCFNIFSLPDYPSKEIMKKQIYCSIQFSEGFGII